MNIKLLLSFSICFSILTNSGHLVAQQFQLKRIQSSAKQGLSQAVVVEGAELVHTTQLLPANSLGVIQGDCTADQTAVLLKSLETILAKIGASKSSLVKLNIYLTEDSDRSVVISSLNDWLEEKDLPAVSFVQTRLPNWKAKVAMDAIIASSKTASQSDSHQVSILPRGDVVYVSGQAEKGDLKQATKKTLESLLRSIQQMQLDRQNIVSYKCFVPSMEQIGIVDAQVAEFFKGESIPAVSHVEWMAGSTHPIEIEMIASAPLSQSEQSVTYFTPEGMKTSPVYSRVARIHGNKRIYISGLYSTKPGNGEEQTKEIYKTLGSILNQTGSDFKHLAKATYYVSDRDASSQLNKLRPLFYDPKRPPAASKAMVKGVGMQKRSLSIDIIATPITE